MKIEKCPFCGGEGCIQEHVFVGYTSTFGVVCIDCCAETRQFFNTKDEAIAAWNRRADHIRDTTKKVSNADRIRSMSDEELAEVSVYSTTRPDFDEGFDGEWYECGDIETWHSVFTADLYDSPDDAISYVLEWLQQPAKEE